MPEIKLRLSQPELDRLNAEAAAALVPRAQLVRDRALSGGPGGARLTTANYHALVSGAVAFMHGDLSRHHVETLVAYVVTHIESAKRHR